MNKQKGNVKNKLAEHGVFIAKKRHSVSVSHGTNNNPFGGYYRRSTFCNFNRRWRSDKHTANSDFFRGLHLNMLVQVKTNLLPKVLAKVQN